MLKNGKVLSNMTPKMKLWNYTKKRIFRFLPKIFTSYGWNWNFFANFQILGSLGCQGWVVIPQNVKNPNSLHPSLHTSTQNLNEKIRPVLCALGFSLALGIFHKVHIYLEYHRVCPLVGIGTLPPPLSPASLPLPPEPKGGGGAHSPGGEGLGESQFRRLE
jgi:hypothetical protein